MGQMLYRGHPDHDACGTGFIVQLGSPASHEVVERALDEQGEIRQHVTVFVDEQSVRAGTRLGLATPVRSGAEIWILPAVSGGSGEA